MLKEQEDTLRYASAIERQFFKVLQTPRQMFKIGFSMFISQGIGSTLISFQMIFQALETEIFRLNFRWVQKSEKSGNWIYRYLFYHISNFFLGLQKVGNGFGKSDCWTNPPNGQFTFDKTKFVCGCGR